MKNSIEKNCRYYIYGISNMGKYLRTEIEKNFGEEAVLGYLETFPKIEIVDNLHVYRPEDIIISSETDRIIIASIGHADAIRKTLIDNGFSTDIIIEPTEYYPLFRSLWDEERSEVDSICFWPPFCGIDDERLVFEKISWFISKKTKVFIPYVKVLDYQSSENITFVLAEESYETLANSEMIFLWDKKAIGEISNYNDKIYLVDKEFFFTTEIGNYRFLQYFALSKEEKRLMLEDSKKNWTDMVDFSRKFKCANIFCNGPSIEEIKTNKKAVFDDSFNILVNATICDKELTDMMCPTCLVMTDLVFMSPYNCCSIMYDSILELFKKRPFWIIVFEHEKAILDANFPILRDYVIGMPFSYYADDFIFPDCTDFMIRATENILTEMAIPVGSSVCDEVNLYGCTGKGSNTNNLWSHSKSSCYSDLKKSMNYVWPSFSRDDGSSTDYDKHCLIVEKIIAYGERKGKKYRNRTTSFIPALESRS